MSDVVPYEIAETIRRKKAQYCRLADTGQWHLFHLIALPTAVFTFVDSNDRVVRQDGINLDWDSLAGFQKHFAQANNNNIDAVHMVNAGELEMADEDEVEAVFAVVYHAGVPGRVDGLHWTGGGHYHETWKRVDGDWFLSRLRMKRLYWKKANKVV